MRARLVCVVIPPLLVAAFVGAQDRSGQPAQPGDRDRAGQPGVVGTAGQATALDGTWTVISAARDGKAVEGAGKLTVSIKNNVATFTGGAGGADKGHMRALRLDFGPQGTVRVSEANADGKFDAPGGTASPGGDPKSGGAGTPPAATGSQPGGTSAGIGAAGVLRGVYVLTPDFLAISLFDTGPARTRVGQLRAQARQRGAGPSRAVAARRSRVARERQPPSQAAPGPLRRLVPRQRGQPAGRRCRAV